MTDSAKPCPFICRSTSLDCEGEDDDKRRSLNRAFVDDDKRESLNRASVDDDKRESLNRASVVDDKRGSLDRATEVDEKRRSFNRTTVVCSVRGVGDDDNVDSNDDGDDYDDGVDVDFDDGCLRSMFRAVPRRKRKRFDCSVGQEARALRLSALTGSVELRLQACSRNR